MSSPRKGNRQRVDHASLVDLHSSWQSSEADGEPLAASATTDKQLKAQAQGCACQGIGQRRRYNQRAKVLEARWTGCLHILRAREGKMHQVAVKLGTAIEHGGVQCDAFQKGSCSTSLQRRWCCAYNVPANNGSRRATRRAEVTGSGGTTSGQWQRDNRAALRWTCDRRKRVHRSQECGHHR